MQIDENLNNTIMLLIIQNYQSWVPDLQSTVMSLHNKIKSVSILIHQLMQAKISKAWSEHKNIFIKDGNNNNATISDKLARTSKPIRDKHFYASTQSKNIIHYYPLIFTPISL